MLFIVFAFAVAGSSAGVGELLLPGVGVADITAPRLSHTVLSVGHPTCTLSSLMTHM